MHIRLPLIAGNWKLNHGPSATAAFFADFLPRVRPDVPETIAFFPPALSLEAARHALRGRPEIRVGVQNIHWEPSGAFTGEISATMAAEAGATMALVGHSERRHVFGESDEDAARKAVAAVDAGITPVICVGETLRERESGLAFERVEKQLAAVFDRIAAGAGNALVIAYEPVWAIGTGRNATPGDAAEMHGRIRMRLAEVYGSTGTDVPILYGGSVKPENAAALLEASDVDGLLVGGASLDPATFAAICGRRA